MANLKVNIYGMEFSNPVMTAAGPGAKDGDLCIEAVKGGAGGLCTKTISVLPADVPRPCIDVYKRQYERSAKCNDGCCFILCKRYKQRF